MTAAPSYEQKCILLGMPAIVTLPTCRGSIAIRVQQTALVIANLGGRRACLWIRGLIRFLFGALLLTCAGASTLDDEMSASLKAFLSTNAAMRKALDGVISELPSGSALHLKYAPSASGSVARATHGYDESGIIVSLAADQQPYDEFIGLYFEIANSISRKSFEALMEEARAGTIAKDKFPFEILRIEFRAVKRTRDVIRSIAISAEQQRTSYFYPRFSDCPDDFDAFLAYRKRVSPKRNPIDDYKQLYEKLQRK